MKPRSTPEFMKTVYELLDSCTNHGVDPNFDAFEYLLQTRDISPEHLNMKLPSKTLLMCAADKGHVRAVYLLLSYSGIDCNIQDSGGNTALHFATLTLYPEVALRLLEAKANPTSKNKAGDSAFDNTLQYWSSKVLHAMSLTPYFQNPSPFQLFVFFYAACAQGDEKMAAQLITQPCVKAHIETLAGNRSILQAAVCGGNRAIVRLLIAHGANVNRQEFHNYTALMRATHYGHADIAEDLINAGAQLELGNSDGQTALDIAVSCFESNYPILPVIKVLLKHGAVLHNPPRLHAALEKRDQRDLEIQNVLYMLCERTNAELQFAISDRSAENHQEKQAEITKKIAFRQKVDAHRMGLSALSVFRRRQVHGVICDSLTMMSRDVCGVVTGYVVDGSLSHLEEFDAKGIDQQLQKIAPRYHKQ